MLRQFLIVALLTGHFIASGQAPDNYSNQLKLSATRTINILNPGIEISYEKLLNNKFSTQVSTGLATKIFGGPFEKVRGFNTALEGKKFLSRNSKAGKYISLMLQYSDVRFEEIISGVDLNTNTSMVDSFTIARKTTSIAFKYGLQIFGKRFVLDLHAGAGLKYRIVKHYDRTLEYKGAREPFDFLRAANVEKKGLAIYLPLNIQLGYRF